MTHSNSKEVHGAGLAVDGRSVNPEVHGSEFHHFLLEDRPSFELDPSSSPRFNIVHSFHEGCLPYFYQVLSCPKNSSFLRSADAGIAPLDPRAEATLN